MKAFFEDIVRQLEVDVEVEDASNIHKKMDEKEQEYATWADENTPHCYEQSCYEETFFKEVAARNWENGDFLYAKNTNFFGKLVATDATEQVEQEENIFSKIFNLN